MDEPDHTGATSLVRYAATPVETGNQTSASPAEAPPAAYYDGLHAAILELQRANISFVPVHGFHAQAYQGNKKKHITGAKEPALHQCTTYQYQRLPHPEEVANWWKAGLVGGIGVYCGDVSRLVCADIDVKENPDANAEFVAAFPDLLDTMTERTPRGGSHRFYRLPSDIAAPATITARGYGELRSTGVLVVIAPTRWRSRTWQVERGAWSSLKMLAEPQLERLQDFYRQRRQPGKVSTFSRPCAETSAPTKSALESLIEQRLGATHYNAEGYSNPVHCPRHDDQHPSAAWNRDKHALHCFAGCTSLGFPDGWNGSVDVAAALGIGLQVWGADTAPLKRTTVEALLQTFPGRRGESLCKTLLGLRLQGIDERMTFTFKQAQELCAGVIGHDGLRGALNALLVGDRRLFAGGDRVPAGTQHISKDTCSQPAKNMTRGRPAAIYTMPTEVELAQWLDIEPVGTFAVRLDDLKNRALACLLLEQRIERRRGKYANRQLAQQYGKSVSTIRRYVAENRRIVATSTFLKEVEIKEPNQVEDLTGDVRGVRGGRYLELQDSGTRFAATRVNAANALAQGETVTFKERGPNDYAIDGTVTPAEADAYRALVRLHNRALRLLARTQKGGFARPTQ